MTEYKTGGASLKSSGHGQVTAMFCRFNVIDHDGDIVLPTAFTNGQEVVMAWAHDWNRIIGKGKIRVMPEGAYFDGKFFLETDAGREAYKTVKAMGELSEWSWGFRVLKHQYVNIEGETVRQIERAEVFEVSPVLKGAGVGTHTVAIKRGRTAARSLPESTLRELAAIRRNLYRETWKEARIQPEEGADE